MQTTKDNCFSKSKGKIALHYHNDEISSLLAEKNSYKHKTNKENIISSRFNHPLYILLIISIKD